VKIPSRIQFYKLGHAPKSSDPIISQRWMDEKDVTVKTYEELVKLWQNQKLEMENQ